jgi:hypothetical protein
MHRAALALLLAGCSYDWTPSAGAPMDAGHDVVAADVSIADTMGAPPVDAPSGADADAAPMDTGTGMEAADCNQLEQEVESAFSQAVSCQTCDTSSCKASTTDVCGCTVYVCDGTAPETKAYIDAVSNFTKEGCLSQFAPCGDSCPFTMKGVCSVTDAADHFGCYY